jgi:hypothetical protein
MRTGLTGIRTRDLEVTGERVFHSDGGYGYRFVTNPEKGQCFHSIQQEAAGLGFIIDILMGTFNEPAHIGIYMYK